MEKLFKEDLLTRFNKLNSFATKDVFRFYNSLQPSVRKSTVNWRIYELIKQGLFHRIGRGIYTTNLKPGFKAVLEKREKSVAKSIKEKFPLVSFCVWHTSFLQEFYHHIANFNCMIVEVEPEAVDPVFHFLHESYKNIFREPTKTLIEDYISEVKDSIVLNALKSESPLEKVDGFSVPALEKILVDLYADRDLFSFIQGNELFHITKNAIEKYSINYGKLLRYAARRGKKEEIKSSINKINGNL